MQQSFEFSTISKFKKEYIWGITVSKKDKIGALKVQILREGQKNWKKSPILSGDFTM